MKFLFLKLKKEVFPSLGSLRPPLFNINLFWMLCLVVFACVLLLTFFVGFKLFYDEYRGNYKQEVNAENLNSLININRLKKVIEARDDFINEETPALRDPSV